jgi:hypothetical protein
MSLNTFFNSQKGSGLSVIFIGLTVTLLVLMVFLSIADYALFSSKRNRICQGIDYAVCAAVQEVDGIESEEGLASGFDEATGKMLTDGIVLNEERADNAFFSTLQMNTGIYRKAISENTMIVTVTPEIEGIGYVIRKGQQREEGRMDSPEQLEPAVNNAVRQLWNGVDPEQDDNIVYVNGNLKTNQFKKAPYYLVFIKDYEIDGLMKKRTATFIGFAGANETR